VWLSNGVFSDCMLVRKILLFMFKKMTYEGGSVTARVSRTCLFSALPRSGGPFITAKVQTVD
jgi:hypothetical protein